MTVFKVLDVMDWAVFKVRFDKITNNPVVFSVGGHPQ